MEVRSPDSEYRPSDSQGDRYSVPEISEIVSEPEYEADEQLQKDVENFELVSEFSRSVSFVDDLVEVEYAEGRDLIKECAFCYTPIRKWVANLKGIELLLYIFVLMLLPFIIRFTFHTSYLNYTESQPSFGRAKEGKLLYFSGAIFGVMMLLSEVFEGLRALIELNGKKSGSEQLRQSSEVRMHRGSVVIYFTKSGFPLWKTRNNKLAKKRPVSLLKWMYSLSVSEGLIHLIFNLRWMSAIGLFIGSFFTLSVLSISIGRTINDSLHYLFAMHLMNGMAGPLFIGYGIKLTYRFVNSQIKSSLIKRGRTVEEPRLTKSGKILLRRPIFSFLGDSCACNYAVEKDSQFPKLYKYSIRYHCVFSGIVKAVFAVELLLYTAYVIAITIFSLCSKISYRTLLSV